jgi:hypothetical protein
MNKVVKKLADERIAMRESYKLQKKVRYNKNILL